MTLILSGTDGLSDVDGSAATPAIRGSDTNTGIFFPAADTIAFAEGGTEVMRIDSSGNVGIGISTPSTSLGGVRGLVVGGSNEGQIRIQSSGTGTSNTDGMLLSVASSNEGYLWNYENAALIFGTNNTERARIDSSGNFAIGKTSASARLNVEAGSGTIAYFQNASGVGVFITAGSNSWTAASDERVKDIVQPISNALAGVMSLRTVIGRYKTDEEDRRRPFLIAQDVRGPFPEVVTEQSDEQKTLGIEYSNMIPFLTAAIQEQQAMIVELKAEVDALKAQLGAQA